MKDSTGIEPNSNFNSLFLLSGNHHLNEDSREMMLQTEYLGTKQQIIEEYQRTVNDSPHVQHISYDENIKLKRELDKIRTHNLALTNKLKKQKNLAETLEKQISVTKSTVFKQSKLPASSVYSSRTSFFNCSNEEILKKIEKIDLKQAEEDVVAESLNKMFQNLKHSSLIWKERHNQALELHKSVVISSDKLSTARTLAMNNFTATQKDVKSFKALVQQDKLAYRSEYIRHKKIKQEEERRIDSLFHKISSSNIDIRRKNQSKDNLLNTLEQRVNQLEEDKHFRHNLFKKISSYRVIIKTIRKIMTEMDIQIDIEEPFKETNTHLIIDTIKQLKFQEDSLSVRFQQLTVDYSVKQKQCDDIQNELNAFKESNIPDTEDRLYSNETYNHIRSSLDTAKELQNKQEIAIKSEKVCIKLYLHILNILAVICTAVSNIHENSIDNSTDLITSHSMFKQLLCKLNRGFAYKRTDETRKDLTKLAHEPISTVFYTEVPDINFTSEWSKGDFKDSIASFSLSYGEIKDAYVQVLGNRTTATNYARLLKEVSNI